MWVQSIKTEQVVMLPIETLRSLFEAYVNSLNVNIQSQPQNLEE